MRRETARLRREQREDGRWADGRQRECLWGGRQRGEAAVEVCGEGVKVRLQGCGVRGAEERVGGCDGGEGGEGERGCVDERAGVVDEVLACGCVR